MGHVHVSTLDALVVFAYVLIMGALWRAAAAILSQKDDKVGSIGKAMSLAY